MGENDFASGGGVEIVGFADGVAERDEGGEGEGEEGVGEREGLRAIEESAPGFFNEVVGGEGGSGAEENFEGEAQGGTGEEQGLVDEGKNGPVPKIEGIGEPAEGGERREEERASEAPRSQSGPGEPRRRGG